MHSLLGTMLLAAVLAGPLDVNTADPAALRAAGFTESQAAQIVRYRTENGAYLQLDELLAVPQVSKAALAPLRDKLTIGGAVGAAGQGSTWSRRRRPPCASKRSPPNGATSTA
jgi:hypothetical protein